jgi:hypothetical protein
VEEGVKWLERVLHSVNLDIQTDYFSLHITKYIVGPVTSNKTESVQINIMEHGMNKDSEFRTINKLNRSTKVC